MHQLALYIFVPKGEIISEGNFDVLNFPKNQKNIWRISALASKMGQIKKNKGPYFVDLTHFKYKLMHF